MDCRLCIIRIWNWRCDGCAGHDERDYEFAKKFNLKIISVIHHKDEDKCYTENGKIINSGKFNGSIIKNLKRLYVINCVSLSWVKKPSIIS